MGLVEEPEKKERIQTDKRSTLDRLSPQKPELLPTTLLHLRPRRPQNFNQHRHNLRIKPHEALFRRIRHRCDCGDGLFLYEGLTRAQKVEETLENAVEIFFDGWGGHFFAEVY